MRAIGIVRKLDKAGRIAIAREVLRKLSVDLGDPLEFLVDGECIVLKKAKKSCVICGSSENTIAKTLNDKRICSICLEELKSM